MVVAQIQQGISTRCYYEFMCMKLFFEILDNFSGSSKNIFCNYLYESVNIIKQGISLSNNDVIDICATGPAVNTISLHLCADIAEILIITHSKSTVTVEL